LPEVSQQPLHLHRMVKDTT